MAVTVDGVSNDNAVSHVLSYDRRRDVRASPVRRRVGPHGRTKMARFGTYVLVHGLLTLYSHARNVYPPAQRSSEARWMFSAASVCLFVCLFVRTITSERPNVGRSNLAVTYIVQKSRPSSKVKVKGQSSQGQKTKNC